MSSLNSISHIGSMAATHGGIRRPDPAKMAGNLFDKLDTSGQGYLQKSDLQTAFDGLSSTSQSASSTSSNVDVLFSRLDADHDGKVTKNEFSSTLSKLAQQLDDQFQSMRMQDAIGGMRSMPPPPANDAGLTKDELTSQLEAAGSSDSKASNLLASIVQNFDKADTDGDGKVSLGEAMSYKHSSQSSSTVTNTSTAKSGDSTTPSGSGTNDQLMRQFMHLMRAYDIGRESNSTTSGLSVTV